MKPLTRTALYLIIVIFLLQMIASKFFLYYTIWWFDMPMHFLGGLWISLIVFAFFSTKLSKNEWVAVLSACGIVLCVGLLWEAYEFGMDYFFNAHLANPLDSTSDVFFDIAGGFSGFLVSEWYRLHSLKEPNTL